jgi:hypothetical protein
MPGALDDNVLPSFRGRFAAPYRAAGGGVLARIFHEWFGCPDGGRPAIDFLRIGWRGA